MYRFSLKIRIFSKKTNKINNGITLAQCDAQEEAGKSMEAKKLPSELVMKFKTLFEKERQSLIYANHLMNENFHLQQEDLLDSMDLTSTELETSMRMRLRNREVLYLKKIDEALQRISNGTFGECKDCGREIELKRLQARPTTILCITCKEEEERMERLHIDGHRSKSLGMKIRFA
jgi:DnaK suppressor protein